MTRTVCVQQTKHINVTDTILCDASVVSAACEEKLITMVQWPEIVDISPEVRQDAKRQLRSLGWEWDAIDGLEDH